MADEIKQKITFDLGNTKIQLLDIQKTLKEISVLLNPKYGTKYERAKQLNLISQAYKEQLASIKNANKEEEKSVKTQKEKFKINEQYTKNLNKFGKTYFGNLLGSDLLTGVKELSKAMIDFKTGVASFNAGSSLSMNVGARNLQLQYGLSGSQAYSFQTAGSMLGIDVTNPENLAFMNSAQRERLSRYMEKYSAWYDRMESSGVLNNIQEMQLEFKELKQDLAMDFLEWVGSNKDAILAIARGTLNVLQNIASMVGQFVIGTQGGNISTVDLLNRRSANITINTSYTSNGVSDTASDADRISMLVKEAVSSI